MNRDLEEYLANLDAKLATLDDAGKRFQLLAERRGWEGREEKLSRWARAPGDRPQPFNPPLTFWTITGAQNAIDSRLSALMDSRIADLRAAELPPAAPPLAAAIQRGEVIAQAKRARDFAACRLPYAE